MDSLDRDVFKWDSTAGILPVPLVCYQQAYKGISQNYLSSDNGLLLCEPPLATRSPEQARAHVALAEQWTQKLHPLLRLGHQAIS